MGSHMARNLLKKNWKVMVYDLNKDAVQAAVQDGNNNGFICIVARMLDYTISAMLDSAYNITQIVI